MKPPFLMFGWFGFNAGGTLSASDRAAIVIANTAVAMIIAMVVWTFIAYFKNNHHFSFTEPLVGAVAGLATITPASGYVTPISSILIGFLAAIICYIAVQLANKWNLDDALDVWGVHGIGGMLGWFFSRFNYEQHSCRITSIINSNIWCSFSCNICNDSNLDYFIYTR